MPGGPDTMETTRNLPSFFEVLPRDLMQKSIVQRLFRNHELLDRSGAFRKLRLTLEGLLRNKGPLFIRTCQKPLLSTPV